MVAKIDPGTAAGQQNTGSTPLKCPRCDSINTKFCYYNNYSLSQPRHFCKSCKRYWTRGGTLRNVPVGGGSRKNKRAKKHHRSVISEAASQCLPPPAIIHAAPTDHSSFLYGLPAINSESFFLAKFDLDAQLSGYERTFQSCLGASLEDHQKSNAAPAAFLRDYTLLNSQIPCSSSTAEGYQQLLSYDELPIENNVNNASARSAQWQFIKENPVEAVNSFTATGSSAAAVADSSYTYWNQAVSGGWPESGSSMAPLF